jgi:phosphoglycolate phosphatase
MGFRAVVFDLDGTLLDTLEDLADSMNAALRGLGLPEHPVDAYKMFVGDGIEKLVMRAAPEAREDGALRRRALEGMRDQYSRRWADKSRPYRGVPELLDALTARGVPLTVLSNKPRVFTEQCVESLLHRWSFHPVLGVDEETPRKPDPGGALRIAGELGLDPGHFLYLGDTGTDMRTAGAAGMYAVGALWGFRGAEELRQQGARTLIQRPQQLLEVLDGISPLEPSSSDS